MKKVFVRPAGGEAAVLAHEDLGAPLAIRILLPHAVDLPQVEGVIEALPAEPAGVSLDHTVALQVTRQHALQGEHFMTHGAQELRRAAGFTRLKAERDTREPPEDAGPNPEDLQRVFRCFTLLSGAEARAAGGGRARCDG